MPNLEGPILVVEDIPNVLELLGITLRFKGYSVLTATNGQEALEVVNKESPALVITDILMPRMDGFSMAYALRKDPRTSAIPIIFLSATYVTPEDKAFALSLGAVRFIEKPIDTEDFLLTVAETLAEGIPVEKQPLSAHDFYLGYRLRLENKLRYKNTQIARTERLLQTLSPDQKPAFEAMLAQSVGDRNEIKKELDQLYQILSDRTDS
jgi:CheY-like chemotaxis protein